MNDIVLLKNKIDRYLQKYFESKIDESKKTSRFSQKAVEILANYTLRGGKRIRPILFIYAYGAMKGKIDENIIKTSIFLELLQSSLLVHDDVIDQDDLRRGEKTVHKQYELYLGELNEHFGKSMAIILGDLSLSYSYEILAEAKFDDKLIIEAVKQYSRFVSLVDFGQMEDTLSGYKTNICESDIETIHYYKTATYTSILPITLGVILAGVKVNYMKPLLLYAKNIGLMFQIVDDIIGIFAVMLDKRKSFRSERR